MIFGIAVSLSVLILSLVRDNRPLFPNWNFVFFGTDLLSIKLIEAGPAATMLMGLAALLFARSQFVYSSFPVFDYRIYRIRGQVSISNGAGIDPEGKQLYAVDLTNVGKGLGVITRARYWYEFKLPNELSDGPAFPSNFEKKAAVYNSLSRYQFSFHDVEHEFLQRNIRMGDDWDALHFGEWTAISPGETRRILVMSPSLGEALVAFDLLIDFESILGDRFRREVYMVPRRQFPGAPITRNKVGVLPAIPGQGKLPDTAAHDSSAC